MAEMADSAISTETVGIVVAGLTALVLLFAGIMTILVSVRKLNSRNPENEPVTSADHRILQNMVTTELHSLRDLIHGVRVDLAILQKAVDNGIKDRIRILEEKLDRLEEKISKRIKEQP